MTNLPARLSLFAASPPGLEALVADELLELGLAGGRVLPGGVVFSSDAEGLARANLHLRRAHRVLLRLGSFNATHLAELRRKAAALPWGLVARPGEAVAVRASCHGSRIYHSGAAAERVQQAIGDAFGVALATADEEAQPAALKVLVRIDNNQVTVSADSSGEHLHKRGYRQRVGKAPMRETLAACVLRLAGWHPEEALLDPMCGSGTLVIEAAMKAAGIAPGAARGFAWERWPGFDPNVLARLRREAEAARRVPAAPLSGADRDAGAVEGAGENARRAGVAEWVSFGHQAISHARPPAERGLLLCNPPYGARIGEVQRLRDLYATLGNVYRRHFNGWRLGFIAGSPQLVHAVGLPVEPAGPVLDNGGLKVRLYLASSPE